MTDNSPPASAKYGARRLTVETTNICNLHCGYCLRDEDALYHSRAEFLPLDLLRRILGEAKEIAGITEVSFTGGEPTLHPDFAEMIGICASEELKVNFVSNGWNFAQLWPKLISHSDS